MPWIVKDIIAWYGTGIAPFGESDLNRLPRDYVIYYMLYKSLVNKAEARAMERMQQQMVLQRR